jgi:hypothetical protein
MKPSFSRSHETDALIALFLECSIGNPVSFSAASKKVGFAVHSTLPAYNSARNIAAKSHNIVIDSVRGFGFVRLDPAKIVKRGGKHLRSIRRRARKAGHEMEIAIQGNLDREHTIKATEQLSRFRIVESTAQAVRAASNKPTVKTDTPIAPTDARKAFEKAI